MAYKKFYRKPVEKVEKIPYQEKFPPSEEQVAIHDAVIHGTKNIHVGAVAGSGKTTTVCSTAHKAGKMKAGYLAFGNTIVKDVGPRLPEWMTDNDVRTGHSFAYRSFAGKKPFIDKNKVGKIIKEYYPDYDPDKAEEKEFNRVLNNYYELQRLIGFVKTMLIDPSNSTAIMAAAFRFSIDIDNLDEAVGMIPKIMEKNNSIAEVIDFNDMLYLPIQLNFKFHPYEIGYIDECQDLSPVMQELVKRMFDRVVTVGDRNQAIMGFAGADVYSIENLVKHFHSVEYPLNTCYRCGHKIVKLAQAIVPHIRSHDNAKDGIVERITMNDIKWEDAVPHMVIARKNSTLVRPCFRALRAGKKANIRGQDIGEKLAKLSKQFKGDTITQFIVSLENYREQKLELMMDRKAQQSSIDYLHDQLDVIKDFAEECQVPSQIAEKITSIFNDKEDGLIFSSIHRSKGLEADEVTILDYGNVELNKPNMLPEDIMQEKNLHYVGLTRAKSKLTLAL